MERLNLRCNFIGKNGVDDIIELVNLPSLIVLDLTGNRVDGEESIEESSSISGRRSKDQIIYDGIVEGTGFGRRGFFEPLVKMAGGKRKMRG